MRKTISADRACFVGSAQENIGVSFALDAAAKFSRHRQTVIPLKPLTRPARNSASLETDGPLAAFVLNVNHHFVGVSLFASFQVRLG